MRISDWSSYVFSSDLADGPSTRGPCQSDPSRSGPSWSGPSPSGPSWSDPSWSDPSWSDRCRQCPRPHVSWSRGPWPRDHRTSCLSESAGGRRVGQQAQVTMVSQLEPASLPDRSEEHTSELQSLMRISYAVFCLKKKKII